ncbi:ISLre2 family transposase [Sporolactobacillus sp. THM7-4]|nr:ISLre2 family transposase [Sporolactobacillus sp. THM7-4]
MYAVPGEYIKNGVFSMDSIKDLFEIWKGKENLPDFEQEAIRYMHQWMCQTVEKMFSKLDRVVVEKKQAQGWGVDSHKDDRTIQFLFGPVTIHHTRMIPPDGPACFPLDDVLKLKNHMRYSPHVEYETASLASRITCRQVADTLATWTPVQMSHTSVMKCVQKVGSAQEEMDQALVEKAEPGVEATDQRKPEFLMTEADGVLLRGVKKRQHIEAKHLIMYEGWEKNGKRRRIVCPYAVMTTKSFDEFWEQAAATVNSRYDLWQTQIVANSDGGEGYSEDRFKGCFCGSRKPLYVQLKIQRAVRNKDQDRVIALIDTCESQLDDDQRVKEVEAAKSYLLNHWDRLFDWREIVKDKPEHAGKLGAMESHPRHLTFRMKKRGMHWGASAEGMVKVLQGRLNKTLKETYLASFKPSVRATRLIKKTVKIASLLKSKTRPSIGARSGRIAGYTSTSSTIGQLNKAISGVF